MWGLNSCDGLADDAELASHPQREHLVALVAQRVDHVELHLPGRVRALGPFASSGGTRFS